MKLKHHIFIFFISLLFSIPSNAQLNIFTTEYQKGMKAYEKGNYKKAQDLFEGSLKDNPGDASASYGMALICMTKDYSNYSVLDAYSYIKTALQNFKAPEKKKGVLFDKQKGALFDKQDLDLSKIQNLKDKIDEELFSLTVTKNTIEGYTNFITTYPDNRNIDKAKELKEQLSFFKTKSSNTESAIDEFIKTNPKSKEVAKVIDMRNLLAFQKAKTSNNKQAINEFITKFPDAKEVDDAKNALIALEFSEAKKQNSIEAYDLFLGKYPESNEATEASAQRNQLAYIQLLEAQKVKDMAELKSKQTDIENKNTRINLFIAGSILMLILVGLILRGYYQKRKINVEITRQKEIIEVKNKEIVDSINYAKRIQESMLPMLSDIKKSLPDSFVYYRPRDIVSGDFYWFAELEGKLFVAAADCTGHGVPGALVSMMGFNFLNQLVSELNVTEPGKILDELHRKISSTLHKDKELGSRDIRDGMDIAMMCIDKKNSKVYYSGAVRPLYYVNADGLQIIKGGYYSIGGIKSLTEDPFATHSIDLKGKTSFYLFSDGYADQFGGDQGKKYKVKKFQDLLHTVQDKSMDEQQRVVESSFLKWMGSHEQVDDVCVIGIRV